MSSAPEVADVAAARQRTERAMRGVFAGTLILEAITVLFAPRAVAQFGDGLTGIKLAIFLGLAAVLIVNAAMLRKSWGMTSATALQAVIIATGVLSGAMFVLGVLFALVWWYEIRTRRELLNRLPVTTDEPAPQAGADQQ